ncbi:MAG: phospho-N-acetylmuramoyl-pentapeptide-transferase [Victivallaceae bacterium]|nr:phospho-N-acetylmuramoyl-pentapeptide-transferase [Victivallaceae bacterium]
MFCYLAKFSECFGPFRLFDYVTFRAGGAFVFSFLIVLLAGGATARALRRMNTISAERLAGLVPEEYIDKRKSQTPCMGGLLLIGAVLISSICWTDLSEAIAPVFIGSTALFSLIGFIDDYIKTARHDRDGMPGRIKLFLTVLVAAAAWLVLRFCSPIGKTLDYFYLPFCKEPFYGPWYCWALALLTVVGASHAVNLTDGKDGLASGCAIFSTLTYAVFAYLMGHKIFASYLNIPFVPGMQEAVVFAAAICGSCIGFLWHNCQPAAMFMGDTGSIALGGAIGFLAVLTRQEVLLLVVGGVFVMEAVSVMLQVASFRLTGKRIFLCTPIHHHFERKNWTESQIVIRFWIIAGVLALLALSSLKLR